MIRNTRGGETDDLLDEWQWPADCTAQREMERHLRCQICGDFFHGPVLLPCSHTFCSTCVRRFLQSKGAHGCCPECKQPVAARDLVPNRALEQVALLFSASKPELLKRLQGIVARGSITSDVLDVESTKEKEMKQLDRVQERMPLLSYSVMKDKEVRRLLDAIHVRVPTKNREEIIQIHKEFVLLSNAQADSVNPKSTAQVREEVVRNHHARMQQKAKTDALRRIQSGSDNSESGNIAASPASGVSVQMRANFDKLRQDIADRKAGKRPPTTPSPSVSSTDTPQKKASGRDAATSVGVWRHFCALDTNMKQEFYVNSVTHEIRVELPPLSVREQSPANRYDDLSDVVRAVAERDPADIGCSDEAKAVTPLRAKGKTKRAIAPAFASPDATSEFQSATEETILSGNEIENQEGEQEQADEKTKLDSLGKHARNADATVSTMDGSVEVIEDADEAASEWQCSRCTLVNEATCQQCEACGYEPASVPAKKRLRKKMHFQSKIALS
uniref:RanBP-type and C3HC4-type zinc finger-containing protein 1 n=1 Tax=Peronospora matthiolae TaxID=2874970 RepID=A0AAV1UNW2_9STRA